MPDNDNGRQVVFQEYLGGQNVGGQYIDGQYEEPQNQEFDNVVVYMGLNGEVLSWSSAAEAMFGYKADEILGQSVTRLLPPDRSDEGNLILDRVRRGKCLVHLATERRRKDGKHISVLLTVTPILGADGKIAGAAKHARHLTAPREEDRRLRAMQAELTHMARLTHLGQRVATLAHEVAQPLTAMTNYLAGARRLLSAGNAPRAMQALDRVAEQNARATRIAERLGEHARKHEANKEIEDLAAVIEEAADVALVGVRPRPEVRIELGKDATEAVVDRIEIQQVLVNLLRNAVEAMDGAERRQIAISTTLVGGMVEIAVADTGHGLPDAVRGQLFQPFVTTKPNGMGVGLSICHTIVTAHGGTLHAEDGEGCGVVFKLTVPAAARAV
jgi:two-component system sensor kinase FixL